MHELYVLTFAGVRDPQRRALALAIIFADIFVQMSCDCDQDKQFENGCKIIMLGEIRERLSSDFIKMDTFTNTPD